ncbi:hypothetical protein Q7P37_003629 [Cladosporium fusiforme]
MSPSIADILEDFQHKPEGIERIAFRDTEQSVEIVPPNPHWGETFNEIKARILSALGDTAVEVHHYGSTSIPDLPAKDVIDIDLVVPDTTDEATYVAKLESAGFRLLLREPSWHEHRFFASTVPPTTNLHVWGPDCAEVLRHRVFRERLLRHPEDKARYCEVKELASQQTKDDGGSLLDYNLRKQYVIREILRKAFVELGYLDDSGTVV